MIRPFSDSNGLRLRDLTRCLALLEADTPNKALLSGPADYLRAFGSKRKSSFGGDPDITTMCRPRQKKGKKEKKKIRFFGHAVAA